MNVYVVIETAKGRIFWVDWIGVADFDGRLRFELVNMESQLEDVLKVFTDPEETATITRQLFDDKKVFEGFTKFKGLDVKQNGNVVVSLGA